MTNELRDLALEDRACHSRHNADLNPFSTQSARHLWQQGWEGNRPDNLVDGSQNWRYWERGRQARLLEGEQL